MDDIKGFIAARVAKELHDGDVVNLGIGLPTLVPNYLDPSISLTLQSENGFVGLIPLEPGKEDPHIVNAGGAPAAIAKDGAFFSSAHTTFVASSSTITAARFVPSVSYISPVHNKPLPTRFCPAVEIHFKSGLASCTLANTSVISLTSLILSGSIPSSSSTDVRHSQ